MARERLRERKIGQEIRIEEPELRAIVASQAKHLAVAKDLHIRGPKDATKLNKSSSEFGGRGPNNLRALTSRVSSWYGCTVATPVAALWTAIPFC